MDFTCNCPGDAEASYLLARVTSVGRKDEHVVAGTVRDLFCDTIPVLLQYQLDQDTVHELPSFLKVSGGCYPAQLEWPWVLSGICRH